MATTKLTLQGIALPLSGLTWELREGVGYYETSIVLPDKIARSIWYQRNSRGQRNTLCKLVFDNGEQKITINGVAILMVRKLKKLKSLDVSKEGLSILRIADRRFFWQNRKWHASYNMIKNVNDRIAIEGIPKAALDHFNFNNKAYKKWSITTTKRYPIGSLYHTGVAPLRIYEILYMILATVEPDKFIGSLGGYEYEKYYANISPNQLNYAGMTLTQVLREVCDKAQAGIGITANGEIYMFPKKYENDLEEWWKKYESKSVGGAITKVNWEQFRPEKVIVRFKKEQEIIIDYKEDGATVAGLKTVQGWFNETDTDMEENARRIIVKTPYVENVAQIPRNETIGGIDFQEGEWVPIRFLCQAWNIPMSKLGENWFFEGFKWWYMGTKNKIAPNKWGSYPSLMERVNTLVNNYRTTFQVHSSWTEQVSDIRPFTAETANHVTGTRIPAFCKTQYAEVARAKAPAETINSDEEAGRNINNAPNYLQTEDIMNVYPSSPAQLLPSGDDQIGIFRTRFLTDKHHQIMHFAPSMLINIPKMRISDAGGNWKKVSLKNKFRIVGIASVIFHTPNDEKQWHTEERKIMNAAYPEHEIFVHDYTAKFNWKEKLVDEEIIKAYADAYKYQIEYKLRDRWVGQARFHGLLKDVFLTGTISSIAYNLTNGGAITAISCPVEQQAVDIYNFVPDEIRKKIFQEFPDK